MNRKGEGSFLQNNALSIIVAILGLLLILYGISLLYQAMANGESKNAQRTIDSLMGKIENLKDGEKGKFLLQKFSGSEKWSIVASNVGDKNAIDKCFFKNCLCICKLGVVGGCQTNGFCREIENYKVNTYVHADSVTYIREGTNYVLKSDVKDVTLKGEPIDLSGNGALFEIQVDKGNSNIDLRINEGPRTVQANPDQRGGVIEIINMNKRGDSEIMYSTAIYIILLVLFFSSMMYFVFNLKDGAGVWSDIYAKEIVKAVNLAKPGDEISLDVHKGVAVALKNQINTNSMFVFNNDHNEVCVRLSKGKKSCYSYFNDVDVVEGKVDLGALGNVLTFKVAEKGDKLV